MFSNWGHENKMLVLYIFIITGVLIYKICLLKLNKSKRKIK